MRYILYTYAFVLWWMALVPTVFAADISFSVLQNDHPNDGALLIQVYIDGKEIALNALEGTVGFLGQGADSITKVVIETGDSVFTLWPIQPLFDEDAHTVRFTAGTPEPFMEKQNVFRMRVYSESTKPVTISWLGGEAYQHDGLGTPEGISSRSLIVKPETGIPNVMRSTSDDRKPPQIISADIAYDDDTYGEVPFISVYATDDLSGISHYEFIENGVKSSTTVGTYVIQEKNRRKPILVIVYDKAGNSSSVKVSRGVWSDVINLYTVFASLVAIMGIIIFCIMYRRKEK